MINQGFIWLALVIAAYGNFFYIRDTLKGKTKPNRITFFLWGFAPLISFFAQREGGGGMQVLYTLLIAIMPFLILLASFYDKKAYWGVSKFDIVCGTLSILGLILLITTSHPILALGFSVFADFFAALPTLIKSYKHPNTETTSAYALEIISSGVILLTIHHWIFANYFFAAYILLMNALFTFLLVFSPKKTAHSRA